MAQAARTRYDYYSSAAPARTPQRSTRPAVRVLPGRGSSNPALQGLPSSTITLFKLVIALLLVFMVVGGIRVWLSASTVTTLSSIQTLESSLEDAQATGSQLEIQHSILTGTTRIEEEASTLGMIEPEEVTYLEVLLPNRIAYNDDGSASLAGTLANIEKTAAAKAS